jgi:hypothetical protein
MSYSSAGFPSPQTAKPRNRHASAHWLGICSLVLQSGCFYFLPLEPVEENVPPTFVRASHMPGSEVVLDDRDAVVWVLVTDPDNAADLSFTWDLTGEGILSGAQVIPDGANRRASQLRLSPEPRYGGAVLTVTANDNSGAPVTVSWPVVLGEGVSP